MKIVINRCFGGFGLSDQAFELLLARKGIEFDKVIVENALLGTSYFKAGVPQTDDTYISEYEFYQNRADTDLIDVIEQLGDAANGWGAELVVVDVPDSVEWHINEYDGIEHVAENHRTWQ